MSYRSRKFVLACVCLLAATALIWFEKISDGVYSSIVIAVIGAYFAANVGQKAVEGRS